MQDFPGQPALVKDILAKLRGSLCHSDMFIKPCSPRTSEKVGLMRKVPLPVKPRGRCLLPVWVYVVRSERICACCRPGMLGPARCGWLGCRTLMRCAHEAAGYHLTLSVCVLHLR